MSLRINEDRQYHELVTTLDGKQECEMIYDPETKFLALECFDYMCHATDEKPCSDEDMKNIKKYLNERLSDMIEKKPKPTEIKPEQSKPRTPSPSPTKRLEMIIIKKDDWLSKITKKRWPNKNWKNWRDFLKPTEDMLRKRKETGRPFNPSGDEIFPGDTFWVIYRE